MTCISVERVTFAARQTAIVESSDKLDRAAGPLRNAIPGYVNEHFKTRIEQGGG